MILTDAHHALLAAAAQRRDHLLSRPDSMTGKAAAPLAKRLIAAGLVAETRVRRAQPTWSESEAGRTGLVLTEAGLAATRGEPDAGPAPTAPASPTTSAARLGRKKAQVIALLARPEGATLTDLIAVTGWLPHTTRAALTGLRKAGHALDKSKVEGRTTYRLPAAASA